MWGTQRIAGIARLPAQTGVWVLGERVQRARQHAVRELAVQARAASADEGPQRHDDILRHVASRDYQRGSTSRPTLVVEGK